MVAFSVYKCLSAFSLLSSLCTAQKVHATHNRERRATECVIAARGDGGDDAPAIRTAFSKCKSNGHIIFANATYYINTVLDTRGLSDVTIDIWGKLVWSKNTTYWLANSMDVGYQNMSTVWLLGGKNINVQGHGTGTFDGNGQTWYDLVKGESNYPHRPMGLTIWQAESSHFSGLSFIQSQMWTMLVSHSKNVVLENISVRSTSSNSNAARNTDGIDIEFSDNITLRGWYIYNSDDSVSLKANATNVLVEDSVFENGLGFALGSIGQYDGKYESIYNVYLRNITCLKTRYGAYIKTWTGEPVGVPPNGGGGGLGYMNNITWKDFKLSGVKNQAMSISQCVTFSGATGDCNSSLFKISEVFLDEWTGDIGTKEIAKMQCASASGGCQRLSFSNMNITYAGASTSSYKCTNVHNSTGTCSSAIN